MKNKKTILALAIVVMVTVPLLLVYTSYASTATTLSVTAGTTPTSVGQTFVASINVAGAQNLWAWNIVVTWNPVVLNATKDVKGPFLTSNGDSDIFMGGTIDNVNGTLRGGPSQTLLTTGSVSGNGVLVTITFLVVGTGTTNISLSNVQLLDPTAPTHVAEAFTLSPTLTITIPSATSSPTPPPTNSPSPTPTTQGNARIQVFTDKNLYAPGDLVQVFANVTSNGAAVASQNVAFTIQLPNSTDLATLVNGTNSQGIANISFRIPVPEPNPQVVYGDWSVIASADVSQVDVTAKTNFEVGYSIIISNITIPNSVHRLNSLPINVTLQILGSLPQGLTLTESILDSAQVPLGTFAVSINTQTQGKTITISASIPIPSWAFIGQATLYVNVLTAPPDAGGVPYCNEQSAQFQILA